MSFSVFLKKKKLGTISQNFESVYVFFPTIIHKGWYWLAIFSLLLMSQKNVKMNHYKSNKKEIKSNNKDFINLTKMIFWSIFQNIGAKQLLTPNYRDNGILPIVCLMANKLTCFSFVVCNISEESMYFRPWGILCYEWTETISRRTQFVYNFAIS